MSQPKIVVWKDRDPEEKKPWVVSFVDYARPGVELYNSREFRRWKRAVAWACQVAAGKEIPTGRGEQGA